MGDALVFDTSVLVNFLAAGQAELLSAYARLRDCRLFVTEHVEGEIAVRYPKQSEQLRAMLDAGVLSVVAVDHPAELATFARLGAGARLGRGECSAISIAGRRGLILAVEDGHARREALALSASLRVFDTSELMLDMLRTGTLTVQEADALKEKWYKEHRFRLPLASFADLAS